MPHCPVSQVATKNFYHGKRAIKRQDQGTQTPPITIRATRRRNSRTEAPATEVSYQGADGRKIIRCKPNQQPLIIHCSWSSLNYPKRSQILLGSNKRRSLQNLALVHPIPDQSLQLTRRKPRGNPTLMALVIQTNIMKKNLYSGFFLIFLGGIG